MPFKTKGNANRIKLNIKNVINIGHNIVKGNEFHLLCTILTKKQKFYTPI